MTTPATLSQTDQRRLDKLAKAAGRTPQQALRFVLRDGFEVAERTVKLVSARMKKGRTIPHEEVKQRLDALIAVHEKSGLSGTKRLLKNSPKLSPGTRSSTLQRRGG